MVVDRDTIVVSDVHLAEFEKGNGLWRRFGQEQFAPDTHIVECFEKITQQFPDRKFEFVFNGDTFDFDVVHLLPKSIADRLAAALIVKKYNTTEKTAQEKVRIILDQHRELFTNLGALLEKGHDIIFMRGNHDVELAWPKVQEEIRSRIEEGIQENKTKGVVRFYDWFYYKKGEFYIEHGNQYDTYTMNPNNLHPFTDHTKEVELSYGSLGTRVVATRLGYFNPYVLDQFVLTGWGYIKHFRKYKNPPGYGFLNSWIIGGIQTMRVIFHIPHVLRVVQRKKHLQLRKKLAQENYLPDEVLRSIEKLQPEPAMRHWRQMFSLIKLDLVLIVVVFSLGLVLLFMADLIFDIPYFSRIITAILLGDMLIVGYFLLYNKPPTNNVYATAARQIKEILDVPTVIMGHTHEAGHIDMGTQTKYLNTGTWAPAYYDVECTKPLEYLRSFAWIHHGDATLYEWTEREWLEEVQPPRYMAEVAKKKGSLPWIRNRA